jgi:hypothetical protein
MLAPDPPAGVKVSNYVRVFTQPRDVLGVQREIEEAKQTIRPLAKKLERLNRQLADMESRAFIEANKITRADVEMSAGDGKPWFGTVTEFGLWMRTHGSKRWAEWNGRIYHAADLMAGRMPDMPGCANDLHA